MTLRLTLLSDGSSDRALLPILRWLLIARHRLPAGVEARWADLRSLARPPRQLHQRIEAALDFYPCDLLFVHRDAEGDPPALRAAEIDSALQKLRPPASPVIKVIPVRMREAWLLIDPRAIRQASGNPNGTMALNMPVPREVEDIADPKTLLYQLLETASGLGPRRRRRLKPEQRAFRVAELIEDYSPLLELPAFRRLDADLGCYLDDWKRRRRSS
jgi:hypothetical protein